MAKTSEQHLSSRQLSANIFHGLIQPVLIIGALNWGLIGLLDFNFLAKIAGHGSVAKGIFLAIGVAGVIELVAFWQNVFKRLS